MHFTEQTIVIFPMTLQLMRLERIYNLARPKWTMQIADI